VGSHGPQNGWHANVVVVHARDPVPTVPGQEGHAVLTGQGGNLGEALRHDGGVVGEVAGQGVGVDRGATLRERRQCVVRSS
jgi:hypothetical protein